MNNIGVILPEMLERQFTNAKFLVSWSANGNREYIDYWCRTGIDADISSYIESNIYTGRDPKDRTIKRRGDLKDYGRRHEA